MDYRRSTAQNPEDNCEYYNRMLCRSLAQERKQPVVAFDAVHEGVNQAQGLALEESQFNGLAARVELSDEARVILTQNINPGVGLMNGTQATVKKIVFAPGTHPNHENPAQRLPAFLLLDVPKYTGPVFFSDPERQTWVPLFPRTVCDADNRSISRTQFPVVLGWALTPWKAQGMTLEKVVVKLGAAVREPGVLFVALSRVRHPDDLMLDDDFPALFEILKQSKHPSFQKRQRWEKEMRAKFARTLRLHMRDADRYCHPGTHVWTADDSALADLFVQAVKTTNSTSDASALQSAVSVLQPDASEADLSRVWDRMQTFPYIFELAAANGTLDALTLQGTPRLESTAASTPRLTTKIHYENWHVALKDFTEFRLRDKLSPALFEHFAQIFREHAPPHLVLARQTHAKKQNFSLPPPPFNTENTSYVCFPYYSPVGYLTLYILKRTRVHPNDDPTTQLVVLQHADVYDEHTRTTTAHFRRCFPSAQLEVYILPPEQVSDFSLLASLATQSISSEQPISNELLTQIRRAVMSYVEALEPLAAKATTAALQDLLNENTELRMARDACFRYAFGISHAPHRRNLVRALSTLDSRRIPVD